MGQTQELITRPGAWLRDPHHPGYVRWWDGRSWTEHVRPVGPPSTPTPDPGLQWLLPVGRSGYAIAAGYLGLLSILMLPAPLAVVFGCVAIQDIRTHPGRLGMGRAVFGIVMGGLFSLLYFVPIVVGLAS